MLFSQFPHVCGIQNFCMCIKICGKCGKLSFSFIFKGFDSGKLCGFSVENYFSKKSVSFFNNFNYNNRDNFNYGRINLFEFFN